jgi:hypothetical protein
MMFRGGELARLLPGARHSPFLAGKAKLQDQVTENCG